jgi:acetylornithine/N-succinyldiaminopimelate aminotransferase
MNNTLMNTYGERGLTFVKGQGCWLWDKQGNKYLDALAGIAVCGVGHANPSVAKAIAEQAQTLVHTSNLYNIAQQQELADKLVELSKVDGKGMEGARSGMEKVFFGNSGAEANEAAIKLARLYGHNKGIDVPTIIVMEKSFHGRTMATLTATGSRKVQAGFEPLVKGFVRAPYNDITTIKQMAANNADIVAILLEPIQGEGGIHIPDDNYLPELRKICDEHGWLLMLDEVQSGNGRTGTFFAYQQQGVLPDVVTTAKGLGNGFPIGACLARGAAAAIFQPGNHGSTYGGNPLACAAALATLGVIENENLMPRAKKLGDWFVQEFKKQLADCAGVAAVRGKGLLLGIELKKDCADLVKKAAEKGLLINVTSGNVIRLLPPLVMSDAEAKQLVDILVPLIKQF